MSNASDEKQKQLHFSRH